jgi:hypothetical protein
LLLTLVPRGKRLLAAASELIDTLAQQGITQFSSRGLSGV